MVFSSAVFLFLFLPVLFFLSRLPVSLKAKNLILTIGSLIFYGYGEPVYVLLMIFSSLFNYGCARALGAVHQKAAVRKKLLVLAVVINIGLLAVFKYTDFILQNINLAFGTRIPLPGISLPIGISFFTFQALSYVIDVYRTPELMQKNYLSVLLYISLFPQLVAGPIVRYADVAEQIDHRQITDDKTIQGMQRFTAGLFKKLFIANTCGLIADQIFALNIQQYGFLVGWLGAVSYALQIYYDFSAYSDMAIGLGKMFGFDFRENFRHPYSAVSIHDFWQRWHISLSSWFKEYVYIPMGGNRKGKLRTEVNKMFVFLLTGIWHGANWTFVLWGVIHGTINIVEDLVLGRRQPKVRWLGNLYTWLTAVLAFVIFRADTIRQGLQFYGCMFAGKMDALSMGLFAQLLTPHNVFMILFGIVFAYPLAGKAASLLEGRSPVLKRRLLMAGSFVVLVLCVLRLSNGSYNPFIYFRF